MLDQETTRRGAKARRSSRHHRSKHSLGRRTSYRQQRACLESKRGTALRSPAPRREITSGAQPQPVGIESMSRAPRNFSEVTNQVKKGIFATLICTIACLATQESSAAIRFKRFPHCPEGLVSKKTCECHRGASGRFHYCHAGYYCDSVHGQCKK